MRFVSDCADAAAEDGTSHGQVGPHELVAQVKPLQLTFSALEVQWMALPPNLLDQLHSTPIKLDNVRRFLSFHSGGLDDD